MKKRCLLLITAALAGCIAFSTLASADFARNKTYPGTFTDVPATQWYAASVKDAYEFGLMDGVSDTAFSPDGTLTVAQGITIAARINETITGKSIPEAAGEWYAKYVSYAVAQGFMKDGQFDSLTREIKRSEIAELLADVCGDLPEINTISSIPDVPSSAAYAAKVLKLYKAGILTGNDDYGTFGPATNLKRSEISAMAVRIADSTKRVKTTFATVPAIKRGDAYCIIEAVRNSGRNGLANGWTYDNRFDLFNTSGTDKANLNDISDDKFYSLIRDFDAEDSGLVTLELVFSAMSGDNGVYVAFEDEKTEEKLFQIVPEKGYWVFKGTTSVVTPVAVDTIKSAPYTAIMNIDLDANTASLVLNNVDCGTISIPDKAISRLVLGTNKVGMGSTTLNHCRMWKDYHVYEHFMGYGDAIIGQKPTGWNISGDFAVDKILSVLGSDIYSVKADSKAGSVSSASKTFAPLSGTVVFETYVLFPKKVDGASVSLMSGSDTVFKFETRDGKLYCGDTMVNDYAENIWQDLYVEADTATGKAIIKVNGKEKAKTDFTAKSFDSVVVNYAPKTDAVMWFDDVTLYNLVEHDDYPSYPVVAESKDYNIGVNSCWLWRDTQSGEGWDSTSPFPEFDPYLGFYDEGLRETADWELKQMAEHGIDFIHACWYAPYGNLTAPIKNERVSYAALHEGYMNAKYSDLVDFCLMWENNGQDVTSFEQFKEYLWKYWKEYYFSDPRYARLDNKAVLTVWNRGKMESAFGGVEGTKKAVQFMNDELKEMGYDGIILLASTQGANGKALYEQIDADGYAATYGYHWGPNGKDGDYQISCNRSNMASSAAGLSHHIPTVSIGFNDVGRNETRDPIVSVSDHLRVCEDIKDILSTYNTGTWIDNTMFVSTWNEYSEGTYIAPTASTGYDYLENIRKVFTNDTSDHTAADAKLTQAQLDRVGHLYPPHHSPIRWLQFEKSDYAVEASSDDLIPVQTFDMTKSEDVQCWRNQFGMLTYDDKGGSIKGTADANDYAICTSDSFKGIDASTAPYLHIRMKNDQKASFEVFFVTEADPKYDNKKHFSPAITATDKFVDYYVNMSDNGAWKGNVIGIRIDPETVAGAFEINLIEFMDIPRVDENAVPKIFVNGNELGFTFRPIVLDDGDFEVCGEARGKGFYSSLRVYHEYDRFTGDGVLTLKTPDERTIVFTVGSDKITVDGKEQSLGYTFRLRDGLPVFHIKSLCNLLGYKYDLEGKTLKIYAANDEELELIKNRVPNQWTFDVLGETEGWKNQNCTLSVENGLLVGVASNGDPAVMTAVSFDAEKYTNVVIGVLYDSKIDWTKVGPQLFFTTQKAPSYSADKCINSSYKVKEGMKDGDVMEVVFDLTSSINFSGIINGLRFDPFGAQETFKIDYVKCVYDPELNKANEVELVEIDDENQWLFDKDGDVLGWKSQGMDSVDAKDGFLACVPNNSDPAIMHEVNFAADAYKYMVVKVVYNATMKGVSPDMFFTTTDSTNWAADKQIKGKYIISKDAKYGDVIEARFELKSNTYTGTISNIRFDPYGANIPFDVDSVRFYK